MQVNNSLLKLYSLGLRFNEFGLKVERKQKHMFLT